MPGVEIDPVVRADPSLRFNPYENPDRLRFAGSMEGLTEWVDVRETPAEWNRRHTWQTQLHGWFGLLGTLLPGACLAFAVASAGTLLAGWIEQSVPNSLQIPLSPILLAILFGLAIRNLIGLPGVYEPGLSLCLKKILRLGVALLGMRLSLGAAASISLAALPVVVGCIATAILLVMLVNRVLGLPRRLGILIAVGTAICGNTAIVALAPVIRAKGSEVSYAVGCITIFGLLALMVYPLVANTLFAEDARAAGIFLGTAIHDTAQVAGAGFLYVQQFGNPEVLETATVTKLLRNLFMALVIPLAAIVYLRGESTSHSGTRIPGVREAIPVFVLGFVGLIILRTLGDLGQQPFGGLVSVTGWEGAIALSSTLSSWCLTVAMASVGLGTHFGKLRLLGIRPLLVGLTAALVVGVTSLTLITLWV